MNESRSEHMETGASERAAGDEHRAIGDHVPAGVWRIDPSGSMVNIRGRTFFRLLPVNGFFDQFEGGITVDEAGTVTGKLAIDGASLQTGIDRRDEQLRSEEILDARRFPQIEFGLESLTPLRRQAERIVVEPQMNAKGTVKLRDATVAMEFPVTVIEHGDHLHIEAKFKFDLGAAGIKPRQPGLIAPQVRVEAALTLRRA